MTVTIPNPVIIAVLLVVIAELAVLAAVLWRWLRNSEDRHDELAEEANMQGDALREALNEIDRYRRLHRGR